ncbi:AAA family ATPase [Streptomyces sp. NPDC001251]
MWEVLAQAGGNVAALHRHMEEAGGEVPSLASLHRVVRRDLQAGRVLPDRAVVRREQDEQQTRQALADLALARPRESGAAETSASPPSRLVAEATGSLLVGESGALAGVALPAGAQLVRSSSVRAVAEAVGQAMATQGSVCVFGDPGRGKTAAVRMALGEVPPGWKVTWMPVPVRPSVAGMRRALFDALALPGRFPHTSALADTAVTGALSEARVLVVDEAQRLPVPCLEYLQSLWDHPGTRITLVLCGAGSERALSRLPQLASRIGAWQEVPRLDAAEVATVVTGFHPLWRTVPAPDLTWIDRSCAHGTFRTWAALTAHLQNALLTTADASIDRALLRRLFQRVAPPLRTEHSCKQREGDRMLPATGKHTTSHPRQGS